MSAEGEAIRSNDYRKDTTVKAPSTRPAAVLGLDVGKSSHWACPIDRDGEVLASAPVRNREAELDALFASAPAGTLVVVDQFRNIGSLAVRRARAAGLGVAHLPGLAASRAAGLFAGEAKTDERDAAVIARTALGVPDSLSGVPGRGEALEAARALSSQRDHVVACATRDKNRLRAVLLESCPALEAAVDLLLASIYFSPFSPTYFRQSRQRGCAGFANADAPLSASRLPPPSRPHRRWIRPSGGTTVPLS